MSEFTKLCAGIEFAFSIVSAEQSTWMCVFNKLDDFWTEHVGEAGI
jgi:hypothetical protein